MSFPLPPRNRRRSTDFDIGPETLGEGALATVYLATEKSTGHRFAMKVFERIQLDRQKKSADVAMEEHCLRRANHPGVVKLYASFRDDVAHYMALELCPGGELWSYVKDAGCPDRLARHYLSQVLEALEYLRDARIVHRDLKAENVMIGAGGACKLIDFGTGKDLANPHLKGSGTKSFKKVMEEYVGTPNFMAPEVIKNRCSDFRSDLWSFGCMVFQVLTGLPPFYGGSQYRVYRRACAARLELPAGVSDSGRDLISKLVRRDPDARLGNYDARDLEEHPFFHNTGSRGAHKRPAPVLSLEELCLRRMGKRWSQLGERSVFWAAAQSGNLRAETRAAIARLEEVAALLAGKGCEQSTSVSSTSSGEKRG